MKTWNIFLVGIMAVLLLVGCGKQPASTDTPADDASPVSVSEPSSEPAQPETQPSVSPDEPTSALAENIIALVNGVSITQQSLDEGKESLLNQYQQIYAQFGQDIRAMLVGPSGRQLELSIEVEALEGALLRALVALEAESLGIAITPDQVAAEFDRQYHAILDREQLTEEQLSVLLEAQGMTLAGFKEVGFIQVTEQLLFEAVRTEVAGAIDLPEDDLIAYFEANRANYETEEQVRASHILVNTVEEAEDILAELDAGASFVTLAKERSIDTGTGPLGGDLGWFARGLMVEPFEEAAFSLEPGKLSQPVESEFGFHIILVADHQPANSPEFDEVRDQVIEDRTQEVSIERFATWYEETYDAAEVVVLLPMLDAVRTQREDIDAGLVALEKLNAEGLTAEEPYLPYIIGATYEGKMREAQGEKVNVEASEESEEGTASLADLDRQIAEYGEKALNAYRQSLEAVGGENAEIASRITALESELYPAPAPEEAPDAAETTP